jgi:4-amino-4-deoxy-L-arabinose transferase-like glycosyltransferase
LPVTSGVVYHRKFGMIGARRRVTAATGVERRTRVPDLLIALFVLAAVVLWLPPLRSSLWLDETGTVWTIKDGLGRAFGRALDFQGQSPLYYAVALLTRALFGRSELALRVPSILALLGATFVVARIGRRLFDVETGRIAALAFACTSSVAFAAADARPYALALLAAALATLTLVRWLDSGSNADLAWYVVAAALTIYAHYLTGVVLAAHVVYAFARRGRSAPSARAQLLAPLLIAASCLPLIPQFAALWDRRGSLSSAVVLRASRLAVIVAVPLAMTVGAALLRALRKRKNVLVTTVMSAGLIVFLVFAITDVSGLESVSTPVTILGVAVLVVAIVAIAKALALGRDDVAAPLREHRATLAFLLSWALLPPLVMYALTATDVARVFVPRYYLSAAPGVALLAAWMIRQVRPGQFRVVLALGMLIGAVLSFDADHFTEDWRGALRAASAAVTDAGEPILIRTDFIEARSIEWLRDPKRSDWLLAPVAAYGVTGAPYLLPYGVSDAEARYVLDLESRVLDDARAFVVVTNRIHTYQSLLAQRMASRGFGTRSLGNFGSIRVTAFERRE